MAFSKVTSQLTFKSCFVISSPVVKCKKKRLLMQDPVIMGVLENILQKRDPVGRLLMNFVRIRRHNLPSLNFCQAGAFKCQNLERFLYKTKLNMRYLALRVFCLFCFLLPSPE